MGRHSAQTSKRLLPALVLSLTFVSVGSPLSLLWATSSPNKAEAEATFIPPVAHLDVASTTPLPRSTVRKPAPQISRHIPKPTSTPTAAIDPTRPTVAQRKTQSAPRSTTETRETPTHASATSKPEIRRQTTTEVPSSTASRSSTRATTSVAPSSTTTKVTTSSAPVSSKSSIAEVAKRYVGRGIPYAMGGNSLSGGMDCSHFVWMVLKEAGYSVTYRDSSGLASWTTRIQSPQPGDLVLFRGHVGIFVGNGMMVDQGSSGGAHLRQIKYYDNFIGYGRLPV